MASLLSRVISAMSELVPTKAKLAAIMPKLTPSKPDLGSVKSKLKNMLSTMKPGKINFAPFKAKLLSITAKMTSMVYKLGSVISKQLPILSKLVPVTDRRVSILPFDVFDLPERSPWQSELDYNSWQLTSRITWDVTVIAKPNNGLKAHEFHLNRGILCNKSRWFNKVNDLYYIKHKEWPWVIDICDDPSMVARMFIFMYTGFYPLRFSEFTSNPLYEFVEEIEDYLKTYHTLLSNVHIHLLMYRIASAYRIPEMRRYAYFEIVEQEEHLKNFMRDSLFPNLVFLQTVKMAYINTENTDLLLRSFFVRLVHLVTDGVPRILQNRKWKDILLKTPEFLYDICNTELHDGPKACTDCGAMKYYIKQCKCVKWGTCSDRRCERAYKLRCNQCLGKSDRQWRMK